MCLFRHIHEEVTKEGRMEGTKEGRKAKNGKILGQKCAIRLPSVALLGTWRRKVKVAHAGQ